MLVVLDTISIKCYFLVPFILSMLINHSHLIVILMYFLFWIINFKLKNSVDLVVKKRKLFLTESNETYTECSRLQINDMCQTILEENVYWLSNEHRKTRNQGSTNPDTMRVVPYIAFCVCACYFTKTWSNLL